MEEKKEKMKWLTLVICQVWQNINIHNQKKIKTHAYKSGYQNHNLKR
jgi:hypothetical protein